MRNQIDNAIRFLEARGFLVKPYGIPETEFTGGDAPFADSYRVLQGDYDTGLINAHELLDVANQVRGRL